MSDQTKRLNEILHDFRDGMLTTVCDDGAVRARPMALSDVERDDDLWFATAIDSGKTHEVERNPHVCVTLQSGAKYASITGDASVVRDRAKIRELWSAGWKAWFDGPDDPSLCLIKVRARRGEYWDMSGAKGVRYLLDMAKAAMGGDRPSTTQGQHGVVKH